MKQTGLALGRDRLKKTLKTEVKTCEKKIESSVLCSELEKIGEIPKKNSSDVYLF